MSLNRKPVKGCTFNFEKGWQQYLRDKEIQNINPDVTGDFLYHFVNGRPEIIKNAVEFLGVSSKEDKKLWGSKLVFTIDDSYLDINKTITVSGIHLERKKARQIAAHKAVSAIRATGFNENLPHQVIGIPNYRGHCFTIPVLIPLFNYPSFVDAMIKLKKLVGSKRETYPIATALYELYREYLRSSRYGQVEMLVHPIGIEAKANDPNYSHFKNAKPSQKPGGKVACLDIDRKLMRVIAILRDVTNSRYAIPGGHHAIFLLHVLGNITAEMNEENKLNPLLDVLYIKAEIDYRCQCNADKIITMKRLLPYISIKAYHDNEMMLQDLINDLDNYHENEFNCEEEIENGELCGEQIHSNNIEKFRLLKLPEILTFHLSGPVEPNEWVNNVHLPEKITVKLGNQNYDYKKYAFSRIVAEKARNSEGENLMLHTYVILKAFDGYYVINNDEVTPIEHDEEDIARTNGENLVFYRSDFEEIKCNFPRAVKIINDDDSDSDDDDNESDEDDNDSEEDDNDNEDDNDSNEDD